MEPDDLMEHREELFGNEDNFDQDNLDSDNHDRFLDVNESTESQGGKFWWET